VIGCASALLAAGHAVAAPITYTTFFEDPGNGQTSDPSLERHAIELIDATPAGAQITFAFRDFDRNPIVNALIAARDRGVQVDGVIDGGERTRAPVQRLVSTLGADRVVLCGTPSFDFQSCIADPLTFKPSLMHNKFLTFSELADGRRDVVLQTSQNFLFPSQYFYYNDMVEIAGDVALHDAYVRYLLEMKAQVRTDHYFVVRSGDDGRNTIFTSPRRQPDVNTDDTIVDRLDEIDCSTGGSAAGTGLIRIANLAFRSERAVILRKLVDLQAAGCDIEGIFTYMDADILAGLVSAGIPVHPMWQRPVDGRRQVHAHTKFWTVDAKSTLTDERTKITYAGSSNWRADEQYSDDLLLRIVDEGVYERYIGYWDLIRSRAVSDLPPAESDAVAPSSAVTVRPAPNGAGWHRTGTTVRIAGSDGQDVDTSGLARLRVELSGAQTGSWDFLGANDAYNVQELPVIADGETTVTYFSEDVAGNLEKPKAAVVRIDRTAPTIAGIPRRCRLWPPNHKLVRVARVSATDSPAGLAGLTVRASSNHPWRDRWDIVIRDGSVWLRASKGRVYRVTATATDVAGNSATASVTCVVHPRDRHRR
jgi:hypothetical protein